MKRFAPFLIVLFIIAAILQIDFFFAVVYLFFGVYILSRVWVSRSLAHLRLDRRFVDRAFPGDTVPVEVTVANSAWLPLPWLELQESVPIALVAAANQHKVVTLRSRASTSLTYELSCRKRGYYRVGPLILRTGDLLGILPQRHSQLPAQHMIVYPQVLPLHELGLPTHAPQPAIRCTTPLFEDPARIMGVRDYTRGDSPRRIHWTATASAGRLLVKQFEPSVARETLVCLDLDVDNYGRRQRYTATELAIVATASILNHIITIEGLPAGLATHGLDPLVGNDIDFSLPPRAERAHLMNTLEILARVQPTSNSTFHSLLRQYSASLPFGATVVVVTGGETPSLVETMMYLQQRGFTPMLILIQPGVAERGAEILGIHVSRVWQTEDLERLA